MVMHESVRVNLPCEMINVTPINPLISRCQIKVCYVGDEPNRNGSVISKEVARDLANSLPGSPIVGYFNEEDGDFEEHNRILEIKDGKLKMKDITRPYGFVDLGAKVWFQKFLDDGVEHEYLVTEGYLWTGQYPECKRVIEKGNNQSMELDEEIINAHWTKDDNGLPEFFIINEAIISKLCILGEIYEPCFEGAQISGKVQFSFEDDFKNKLFSMMQEIKELLNEGGVSMDQDVVVTSEDVVVENTEFADQTDNKENSEEKCPKCGKAISECECDKEEYAVAKDNDEDEKEETCPECGKPIEECTCEEDKKDKYNLNEIPEYMELENNYNDLQSRYSALEEERNELLEFKKSIEKKEKEAMIDGFYMLSDEDKKDVIDNIDTYSLDDIEAKLSIICVRNRISFDDNQKKEEAVTYSLNDNGMENSNVPAWVKAVQNTAKSMN